MRPPSILTIFLLGFVLIVPVAEARGFAMGKSAGRSAAPSRAAIPTGSAASIRRSPMTGSKISRPALRPAPTPTARPIARPAALPIAKPTVRPTIRPTPKPTVRPSVQRPSVQPSIRPTARPATKPAIKPGSLVRPDTKPGSLVRPATKPATNPIVRPDNRPSISLPDKNRPTTLPGMVTYPNRPTKPSRPSLPPGIGGGINRPGGGNLPGLGGGGGINRPGIGNLPGLGGGGGINRPGGWLNNRPGLGGGNWNPDRWGGKGSIWGNNINIGNNVNLNINNNFFQNNNWSYRPSYWGARPWWGAGHSHNWHHGHWNYGWNRHYYHRHWWYDDDDDFGKGFMWGIGVWSLGNLIYNMGYQSYHNPYPAPPVQYYAPSGPAGGAKSAISYAEPVSVVAAGIPPGDDGTATVAETKSAEALERSRRAFKQGDYPAASKAVDEALAYTPGDVTLHEYRGLVFFALGKYSDAAGVLNSTLASGPGWGWDTMIGFYNGTETYHDQLRKLEAYVKASPDKADARFLLGYHYMVCGHVEKANVEFAKACELQPADSISRQLRDLTANSIPDSGETEAPPPPRPAPVPAEKLVGTWVSDRGQDGKVTFTMTDAGQYTWSFMNGGQTTEMKGVYSLNEKGLLVLGNDDSQLYSAIEMKEEGKLHFTLVGAPDGDPGLDFVKG